MLSRFSIRQLLLLAFLLAGLLPAMLVSFLSFYQTRTVLKKEISRDMQTLSNAVANDIERMMFERMHNVQSWSQLAIMQEIKIGDVDKRLSGFLHELQLSYGNIYQVIDIVDMQGRIIASSNAKAIGETKLASKPWFTAKLANNSVQFSEISHNTFAISQKVIDEVSGQEIGNLIAEFNLQVVSDLLNNAIQKPTAAALMDGQNRVIASTRNWAKVDKGYQMHANTNFKNQFASSQWKVRVEKLHSSAVAPVHRLGYIFLALLITTLLLAALLVRPIAQAITKPLSHLTKFVRNFNQQQPKPPKTGPPEVRELGAAFETMMHDLAKSQEQLTRAAKLAVVGEMAAAMSHEVRTPLGILRSSADVLNREKNISNEGKEVVGFITSETERLNKLVSTLIDAARPRTPTFVEASLNGLITNVLALLRAQAQAKNINITFIPETELVANIDNDQMVQVMMNLLMNAIQILPNDGKIEVTLRDQTDHLEIAVADNGTGIPEENQTQIFEPFFTQRAGGVGLGLAIVRQIVQAHSGEINYQKSQMGGAQFTIQLPKN
jgi:two-component system, NtrC family, sensor histidine kinase HydH